MKSLTLGKKALLICLVLGLLDVFQGAFSLLNLYLTRITVNELNSDTYATLYWAGKLKGVAKDQRIAIIFYLNSSSKEEMDKYSALVENNEKELSNIKENYPKFYAQDRAAIAVSAREQAKFYQAWKEIGDLVRAGKKKKAWEVYNTKLMAATLGRRKMEDELATIGKERGQRLSKNAIHAVSMGIPLVWAILVLTVILGTSSFLLFVSSVRRSSRELKESDDRLAMAILATRTAGLGIWVHEIAYDRMIWDDRMFSLYGIAKDSFAGTFQGWLSMVHPEDRQWLGVDTPNFNQRETISEIEYRIIWPDGSVHYIRSFARGQRNASGQLTHVIGTNWDITAQKQAEMKLRESEERYRVAFQTNLDAIMINHLSDGKFVDVNQAYLDITGFEREEVIGRTALELGYWADPLDARKMVGVLRQNSICRGLEARLHKKNGAAFWGQISASTIEIDGVACILSVMRDISQAKLAEEEIRSLADYDPLTNLPNRRLLMDRLQQALAAAVRHGHKQALLFIDLDNFKTLNDTLGHKMGDLMLKEVARRLVACVRATDTVARLGGDEFVVILGELNQSQEMAAVQAKMVAENILAAVSQTYFLAERECLSTSSIGITIFGDRADSVDQLLLQADIAMYEAKASGRNTFSFFAPALQASVLARAAMEEEIRRAIKAEQFMLYYQPQVDRGHLFGVEALLRWYHPGRGFLPPDEFIPLAEETGLILPLGDWVLETACAQIAKWAKRKETAHLSVSVNISARQIRHPNFVEQVLAVLERTGANPKNLMLELTESLLVDNIEDVIGKMTALKSHGLSFSLDDFGTGYSSLSYLKRLPLDQLKIDKAFIQDMMVDDTSGAIAQSIISLGRAMRLSVIAEGVETEAQREFISRLGCHAFQGFLFSRPLPVEEFERRLAEFSAKMVETCAYDQNSSTRQSLGMFSDALEVLS